MTMATLSIDRRFCGPPGSGNGGYTAGRLAALIGGPAEIRLRRPPPLETEMRVERAGSRLLLMHGDDLIAEGQKTVVELAIPECPSLHEARSASTAIPAWTGTRFRAASCAVRSGQRKGWRSSLGR